MLHAFDSSDGHFILASALSCAQVLPHGVYVAMNIHAFAWDNVREDNAHGHFDRIRPG